MASQIFKSKPKSATITIKDDKVTIDEIVFVHDGDFSNVRAEGVYQTKIGLHFKKNEELAKV